MSATTLRAAPEMRRRAPGAIVIAASTTLLALATVDAFAHHYRSNPAVYGYLAPQYWLDYSRGFVRRGLPGALLSLDGPPSYVTVRGVAVLLTAVAATAVGVLAHRAASSRCATRQGRVLFAAVVLTSPLSLSWILRDVGRYDTLGILAVAVLALVPEPNTRAGRVASGAGVACICLLAIGAEEFLLAYLLPVVAVRMHRHRSAWVGWSLGPAVAVAAASFVLKPSAPALAAAASRARSAGSPLLHDNALTFLGFDLGQEQRYAASFGRERLVVAMLVMALLYAATLLVLRLHRPSDPVVAGAVWVWLPAVSLVFGVLGIDERRWWMLALVGAVGCVAARGRADASADGAGDLRVDLRLTTLVVVGLLLANAPLTLDWQHTSLLPSHFS